eukprot:gene8044-biopygen2450
MAVLRSINPFLGCVQPCGGEKVSIAPSRACHPRSMSAGRTIMNPVQKLMRDVGGHHLALSAGRHSPYGWYVQLTAWTPKWTEGVDARPSFEHVQRAQHARAPGDVLQEPRQALLRVVRRPRVLPDPGEVGLPQRRRGERQRPQRKEQQRRRTYAHRRRRALFRGLSHSRTPALPRSRAPALPHSRTRGPADQRASGFRTSG